MIYGCPLTERPSTHRLKRECYLSSYVPSHSIYTHIPVESVILPQQSAPRNTPKSACVEQRGGEKKEEAGEEGGGEKESGKESKRRCMVWEKRPIYIFLPRLLLGHTTSPPSNKQSLAPLFHTAHYTYKYKHTLLSFPLQVSFEYNPLIPLSPPQSLPPSLNSC